ncbi:MAG TPA: SDR family oxidoreductase [Immundisolibacter sp.]|nr:SDR family oxidoreductase [Immundisolibacter sp.]
MELNGKTAVLTGAAGGIGSAMAEALAGAGVRLVLVGRNAQALQALAARLGAQHLTVTADLATDEGRQRVQHCCAALPDGIDILINNAGISAFGSFDAQAPALLSELVTTNLLAPMLLTGQLLPLLREAPRGLIVNVGSAFGAIGYPGFVGYSASKFGLRGFSEALRRELAGSTVGVLHLAPRATATAINDARVNALNAALGNRIDSPAVVAEALLRQLRSERPRASIGGPERLFAFLNGLLPGLLDRALARQLPVIRRILAP